jgi:hypothetical protein
LSTVLPRSQTGAVQASDVLSLPVKNRRHHFDSSSAAAPPRWTSSTCPIFIREGLQRV